MQSLIRCRLTFLCWIALTTSMIQGQEAESRKSASEIPHLQILSYNIHHGRGGDDQVDLERLARVIKSCQPDLVALQEVDQRTRRTGGVDQTAELAKLTGLHAQFAKQIDFEGGGYGQALLSRWPLSDLQIHWLPGEPEREQRIVATCQVELPGRRLRFGTTHLHHNNAEMRLQQAHAISEVLSRHPETIILAGDLNAEPQQAPIADMLKSWTIVHSASDLKTFPAVDPTKQIDYILFRPFDRLRILSSQVIDESNASDHRPLLAVLEWNQSAEMR